MVLLTLSLVSRRDPRPPAHAHRAARARAAAEAVTATATPKGPGRVLLTIITPGQGSSGVYTPEVLERAATEKVFPRGTQGMVDHPTLTEGADRPEGSLHNLALVLTEDARWDGNALVAEARVRSAYRDLVDEFADFIGVSISAAARRNASVCITASSIAPHLPGMRPISAGSRATCAS